MANRTIRHGKWIYEAEQESGTASVLYLLQRVQGAAHVAMPAHVLRDVSTDIHLQVYASAGRVHVIPVPDV